MGKYRAHGPVERVMTGLLSQTFMATYDNKSYDVEYTVCPERKVRIRTGSIGEWADVPGSVVRQCTHPQDVATAAVVWFHAENQAESVDDSVDESLNAGTIFERIRGAKTTYDLMNIMAKFRTEEGLEMYQYLGHDRSYDELVCMADSISKVYRYAGEKWDALLEDEKSQDKKVEWDHV